MAEVEVPVAEYERRLGLWLEALESGGYDQTREYLRYGQSYCCLGVLCDVYRRDTGKGHWGDPPTHIKDGMTLAFIDEQDQSIEFLPLSVQEWIGLYTTDGDPGGGSQLDTLANCNDNRCLTFKEIAEILRAKPRGLFTWTKGEENTNDDN